MAWEVYMLECADGTLYTGMTDDMDRRLAAHRAGKGAKYTRRQIYEGTPAGSDSISGGHAGQGRGSLPGVRHQAAYPKGKAGADPGI